MISPTANVPTAAGDTNPEGDGMEGAQQGSVGATMDSLNAAANFARDAVGTAQNVADAAAVLMAAAGGAKRLKLDL